MVLVIFSRECTWARLMIAGCIGASTPLRLRLTPTRMVCKLQM